MNEKRIGFKIVNNKISLGNSQCPDYKCGMEYFATENYNAAIDSLNNAMKSIEPYLVSDPNDSGTGIVVGQPGQYECNELSSMSQPSDKVYGQYGEYENISLVNSGVTADKVYGQYGEYLMVRGFAKWNSKYYLDACNDIRLSVSWNSEETNKCLERIEGQMWHSLIRSDKHKTGQNPCYREYLKSKAWDKKRKDRENIDGKLCICGQDHFTRFDTHHKTYERVGYENLSDLVRLCKECHKKYHDNYNYDSTWPHLIENIPDFRYVKTGNYIEWSSAWTNQQTLL